METQCDVNYLCVKALYRLGVGLGRTRSVNHVTECVGKLLASTFLLG